MIQQGLCAPTHLELDDARRVVRHGVARRRRALAHLALSKKKLLVS